MPRPGPSVTSTGSALPGSDPYSSGLYAGGGGTINVRPGSVGTVEIADGTVALVDLGSDVIAAIGNPAAIDGGTP